MRDLLTYYRCCLALWLRKCARFVCDRLLPHGVSGSREVQVTHAMSCSAPVSASYAQEGDASLQLLWPSSSSNAWPLLQGACRFKCTEPRVHNVAQDAADRIRGPLLQHEVPLMCRGVRECPTDRQGNILWTVISRVLLPHRWAAAEVCCPRVGMFCTGNKNIVTHGRCLLEWGSPGAAAATTCGSSHSGSGLLRC